MRALEGEEDFYAAKAKEEKRGAGCQAGQLR